ncbi:MAG TPA: CinA family nicotinamide mononucleotide deamidase-related protein [Polyangia bacterium]|jgi:nicotinamide-nucleotide amidase|nr:CinA family nicotinamide mononucleotide deamidase-related protein [Polyangia bacterium]
MKTQRAALLAIGDEVLRGEVANSNGTFIADRLFEAGFEMVEQVVVSDDPLAIREVLVRLRATADVIIATGGLGPTEDDRTVDVVADLFGTGTVADEPSLGAMKKRFSTHGFEMTPNNLRQVRIPVGAKALPNNAGIAPGFVARIGGADAYFLPGVPREMERMFVDEVLPRLQRRMAEAGLPRAAVRTWHVYGMGESHIDHRLAGLLTGVEGSVTATLHFRTSHPVNHVKVVVRGASVEDEQATLERIDGELRKRIGPGIYAIDGESFPGAVAKALRAQDPPATLAIAESCTGGLAGELVTREPGSSTFFRGGIIAYSDEIKTGVLGVKPETIADFGAVSEPTAREMAEGAKRVCGSLVAVAITGVAGPGGGTPEKPVGTVCFAVCGPGTTRTSTKLFAGNRERVRVAAAYYALDLARRYFDTRKR